MSRLLDGNIEYNGRTISIEEYREKISARSLYSIDNEYENTNLFSLNNKGNVASSISTVLNVIPQYNRMQVNTNLLGNTFDVLRDDGSALAKIGLIMLGKHMAYNSAMNLSVKYIPSVDLSQALKGNLKDVFTINHNNTITVKDSDNNTFLDNVGNTASNILGIDTYDVFGNANPFSKNPSNIDYLENTGKAQLSRFLGAVSLNIYKPLNNLTNSQYSQVLTEKMNTVGPKLLSSAKTIFSDNNSGQYRPIFNFDDNKAHPYFNRFLSFKLSIANVEASENMILSYSVTGDTVQEYAPTSEYIRFNFGDTTKKRPEDDINEIVKDISNFSGEDLNNQIVWGRDGVGDEAKNYINNLRGNNDSADNHPDSNIFNTNNIRKGILEYTRNLLNASEGNFVDMTRKVFKNGNHIIGFNGSPLWTGNNSEYSSGSRNDGKTGIRQHTILDPYDKVSKLIRFKGNTVYNNDSGNKYSVIYKNVLPRIHPTDDENSNKNLMFSLENLAIGTIRRDRFGIIDDEFGTPIPLSEVGQFGGRKMWFPPYNIQLNEVSTAKYESTVMVGRNEPMYNYQNSERSAVLSFSLLVDYPEQLRNLIGKNKNKEIADFFAFGGDKLPLESDLQQIEKKIDKLKKQLDDDSPTEPSDLSSKSDKSVNIYFQNNKPAKGEESVVIQTMYDNPNHYEIIEGLLSANDENGFGLNNDIYYVQGVVEKSNSINANDKYILIGGVNQYDKGINDNFGNVNRLTEYLKDFFDDEDNRKYYNITISGYASKLFLVEGGSTYNKKIAERRINAAIVLIKARLTALYDATVANDIINNNIQTINYGDSRANPISADPKNIHDKEVKEERRVTIKFARNSVPVDKKEQLKSASDIEREEKIKKEINILENERKIIENDIKENIFKERDEVILNSFESISKNKYYPVFHSQTPEDFHRRLTFLQQCTRQGAAKRYDVVDENGVLRAKNSVFGKQPICILRVGDFFNTKVIIESVTIDYNDTTWDLNPEGFGLQPMIANITLQMKLIGGQSLKAPIDALQNAVSFNYYANSTFTDRGVYKAATEVANDNYSYLKGVVIKEKNEKLNAAYETLINDKVKEGDE
jgi:hypothetical protein